MQRDAAIVSNEPGTTRDIIEVRMDIKGYPVLFQDTAGLRETRNKVERIGIERSHSAMDKADLILFSWFDFDCNQNQGPFTRI